MNDLGEISCDQTPTQNSRDSIDDIFVKELLEEDTRPTFILDLQPSTSGSGGNLNVVYSNKALRFFDNLRNVINADTYYHPVGSSSPTSSQAPQANTNECSSAPDCTTKNLAEGLFKNWANDRAGIDHGPNTMYSGQVHHTFLGLTWSYITLRSRWRVVRAASKRRNGSGTPMETPSRSRATSVSRTLTPGSTSADPNEIEEQPLPYNVDWRILTTMSPVGVYLLNPAGDILYCNDMWYEITGHPRGLECEMSFMNVICESDHPIISAEWETLIKKPGKRVFELALRNASIDRNGRQRQKYILASCEQEWEWKPNGERGQLKYVLGCITDSMLIPY